MRPSLSSVGIVVALGLGACGISVVGEAPEDGSGGDAAPDGRAGGDGGGGGDAASPDADSGSLLPDACPATSCTLPAPPMGWSLVVFGGASDACPAGFNGVGAIEGPTAKEGACACGACAYTTHSDCNTGNVTVTYDIGGPPTCGLTGTPIAVTPDACMTRSDRAPAHIRFASPPAVPGTCTATAAADKTKVTSQAKRVCSQQAGACLDSACKLGGGAKACIMQAGTVECPAATPDKHVVGDDFTLTCAACGCTVNGSCSGSMDFYKDANCVGTAVGTIPSDTCTSTAAGPPGMGEAYKWRGTAADTCSTTPPAGAVALTGTRTVCCP